MVGTVLVIACPIWNCISFDTYTPCCHTVSVGIRSRNAKVHSYKLIEVGIIEYLLLLVFLVFASCLLFLMFAFSFFIQHRFVYWIFSAISTPFIGTFNPLALVFAIHIPISATCKQHQHRKRESRVHREEDLKTINKSDAIEIPSYTTWDPPHSSFDDVPFVQID